jgi:hypothetical protein
MRTTLKRVYKEEVHNKPLLKVKKSVETQEISSWEESIVFPGFTEVILYSGETFVTPIDYEVFTEDMAAAAAKDKLEEL